MANQPYDSDDDEQHAPRQGRGHDRPSGDASDPRGEGPDGLDRGALQDAEQGGGLYNPGGEDGGASSRGSLKDSEETADNEDGGGLYNEKGDRGRFGRRKPQKNGRMHKYRRGALALAALSGGAISLAILLFTGGFSLTHFMKNIEAKGFLRYQVDLQGRSSKWITTYMELRMGEVEDFDHPDLAPNDRDNIVFRANKVDNNKYFTDWYRTMRASKFEQDLLDKYGIKFTSVAYKEGNTVKFRPGVITFKDSDESLKFDPSPKVFDELAKGNPNLLNGELKKFIEVDTFQNDKLARAELKRILKNEYPGIWKSVKRFHLRHDIQNMIGVRNWRFFENKRNETKEKLRGMRNDLIVKAAPEDTRTGKFVQCLFGITNCKASADPGDPEGRQLNADGTSKEGDKQETNSDGTPKKDADGNTPSVGDGSGERTLSEAAGATARDVIKKFIAKAGILSLIDSLSRIDKAIHDHSLSKMVLQAKTAQAIGVFTAMGVAADQLTTGEVTSQEVAAFNEQFQHPTKNEGWTTVVDPPSDSSTVSAASTTYTEAKNKKEFCSQEHQTLMAQAANLQASENEYQFLCSDKRVGSASNANALEDAWNNTAGGVLHPLLAAFRSSVGVLGDVFSSIVGKITGPILDGILSVTGTADDVQGAAAYGAEQAMAFAGGGPPVNKNSPSGQVAMQALQGSSAMAEATTRYQGGALTTTATRALANKNVLAYEQNQNAGFSDRYFAISNPQSFASRQLFSLSTFRPSSIASQTVSYFGSTLSSGFKSLFTRPASADEQVGDGYRAAKFAAIDTYDLPSQCLNQDPLTMTPQSSTNADDLGLFSPDELTWELMSNKETWFDALYSKTKDENLARTVWNCALFDNTVRGGVGAKYGYQGEDAFEDAGSTPAEDTTSDSGRPSGDAQELAQQLLKQADGGKVRFNVLNSADVNDRSTPKDNVVDMSKGQPAQTTSNCSGRGAQPPHSSVNLNTDLLAFLVELSQQASQTIQINALAGQCHGETTSNHYKGTAVDFDCPFDAALADKVGKKYNISDQTGEACANAAHYHYSVGGH